MFIYQQNIGASVLGIDPSKVAVETLWAGGSFGRRAIYDSHYVAEAASIAKSWYEASGKAQPIKLVYTREDDIRGGYYRPAYAHKVRVGLDETGQIAGWDHRIAGQSIFKGTPIESFIVHLKVCVSGRVLFAPLVDGRARIGGRG